MSSQCWRSYVEVKGIDTKGEYPPLVFIHGSYATTSTWKMIVNELAKNRLCLLVRLPGHGSAPPLPSGAALDAECCLIENILNHHVKEPVHLIGHSFGGVLALSLLLRGRVAIARLSLFEPVAVWLLHSVQEDKYKQQVDELLVRCRDKGVIDQRCVCELVIDFWAGEGQFQSLPAEIQRTMVALVDENVRHWQISQLCRYSLSLLRQCMVPVDLVYGTESNPVVHSICHHLAQLLPVSKTCHIEAASHFLVTSHPKQCVAVINRNLGS
ncbi:alpha/beta fold hydrolase [Thaumasiovibrio sp. DFM-14]|uniref:alpha/beta fold hydrolase n=1 Tax=Thaumasiovibrio sp. DFM-14 TaxID=3384792 RepID=UPI0039A1BBBD